MEFFWKFHKQKFPEITVFTTIIQRPVCKLRGPTFLGQGSHGLRVPCLCRIFVGNQNEDYSQRSTLESSQPTDNQLHFHLHPHPVNLAEQTGAGHAK